MRHLASARGRSPGRAAVRPIAYGVLLCLCAVALGGYVASTHDPPATRSVPRALDPIGDRNPAMLSSAGGQSGADARPATIVKRLSCEKLPDVPGKAITTMLVTFPPRAFSPAHRHPGDVTAFVIKGAIRSQMEGSPAQTYPAGSTWFEPTRALHAFAENPSTTETAELLAVFVADEDCGPLVIPEPKS